MRQAIEIALNELGCSIGLGPLCFNDAGQCLVMCDDLLLVLEVSGDRRALTMLCQLSDGHECVNSIAALTRSNSLFEKHGFCLAVEPQTKSLMLLCRAPRVRLDVPSLCELLSDFVNTARTLTGSRFDAPHPVAESAGWMSGVIPA